jgi:hypothetical protein
MISVVFIDGPWAGQIKVVRDASAFPLYARVLHNTCVQDSTVFGALHDTVTYSCDTVRYSSIYASIDGTSCIASIKSTLDARSEIFNVMADYAENRACDHCSEPIHETLWGDFMHTHTRVRECTDERENADAERTYAQFTPPGGNLETLPF